VREIDALFVEQPGSMTPLDIKGVGELPKVGGAHEIANAVYHATGIQCLLVADLHPGSTRTVADCLTEFE
jgi:CO/xanthine dehydrogenase Mo-binding subunit